MARVGEAVLELRTDGSQLAVGVAEAERKIEGLRQHASQVGAQLEHEAVKRRIAVEQMFRQEFERTRVVQEAGTRGVLAHSMALRGAGRALSNFGSLMSGAAAIGSVFARNNEDLRKKLETFSLAMAAASTGVRILGSSLQLLARGPIGIIILAIGAAIAIGIALHRNWDAAVKAATKLWQTFADFLRRLWGALATAGVGLGKIIAGALTLNVDMIREGWDELKAGLGDLKGIAVDLGVGIKNLVLAGWDKLSGLFESTGKKAKDNADEIRRFWEHIQQLVEEVNAAERVGTTFGTMVEDWHQRIRKLANEGGRLADIVRQISGQQQGAKDLGFLIEMARALGGQAAVDFLMEFGGKLVEQGLITSKDLVAALQPFLDAAREAGADAGQGFVEEFRTSLTGIKSSITDFAITEALEGFADTSAAVVFLQNWRDALEVTGELTDELAEKINRAMQTLFGRMETVKSKTFDLGAAMKNVFADAFTEGMRNLENFGDALNSLINSLLNAFTRHVGEAAFQFLFPTKKAHGGSFSAFQPLIVGEAGPELAMFPRSGTIVPHHELASAMGGGGPMIINVDARGAAPGVGVEVRRAIAEMGEHAVRASVAAVQDEFSRGGSFRSRMRR